MHTPISHIRSLHHTRQPALRLDHVSYIRAIALTGLSPARIKKMIDGFDGFMNIINFTLYAATNEKEFT